MGCATSLVKYILFLFNLAFVLGGITFIALGVVIKLNLDEYFGHLENLDVNVSLGPTLIIVVGVVVFIISFFGCCGAIKESTCMLTTYAVILIILFILQIALGIFAFLQFKEPNQDLTNKFKDELYKNIELYNTDEKVKKYVDEVQSDLGAIAFIAIGVIFKLNIDAYTEPIEKADIHFGLAPTLMIIVGAVVLIISFFGCCGAIRESTCMLTTYAIVLLTLFILQVALGVYAFLQFKNPNDEFTNEFRNQFKRSMAAYHTDDKAREFVDLVQYEAKCCGAESRDEWSNNIPSSCCPDKPQICTRDSAFRDGCDAKIYTTIHNYAKIIGIVAIVIAAVELVGAIIALCLSSSIRNHERRGNYA